MNNELVTSPATIRLAVAGDLDGMLRLAEARRTQYATYQPIFWRPAADAVDRQRPHLAKLIEDGAVITLVADTHHGIAGFVIATIVSAPPVYDPGGPTCVVDDFTVDNDPDWSTVGADLLRAVRHIAQQKGAEQVVVVCGYLDVPKRMALQASGLSIASEWWVGPLDAWPSAPPQDAVDSAQP